MIATDEPVSGCEALILQASSRRRSVIESLESQNVSSAAISKPSFDVEVRDEEHGHVLLQMHHIFEPITSACFGRVRNERRGVGTRQDARLAVVEFWVQPLISTEVIHRSEAHSIPMQLLEHRFVLIGHLGG